MEREHLVPERGNRTVPEEKKKHFFNMDEYLRSLGLFRKMVARDASSLFRAVSEQLYCSQNYHYRIRQECADYMRTNRCNFEPFVEGSFEKYLQRLEDPRETVGKVGIKALSQLYRHCFLIYRFPGKPATVISAEEFDDKVTLCCSITGHYDIVYPRTHPASAALCQSLLYEVLYTQVFGFEEAELCQAMEALRFGSRRYRNSPAVCSDADFGYDTPEDRREESDPGEAVEEKQAVPEDTKPPAEAPPPSRLSLPYKVMKSLDGEVYRNLEFDMWQDTCKEMQKTDYMVCAGRKYFLGDKCQVRLEPEGELYYAFIQELGTHASAVTVFIEELGDKHLVELTDLKPVNPVPAWNVAAPSRNDPDGRRHHYFWKSHAPVLLPPRFQPTGHPRPLLSAGAMTYDPYAPPHHHHARRYYQDYQNYAFRSWHSRRQLAPILNKECQFGFSAEGEEPSDLDAAMFHPPPPQCYHQSCWHQQSYPHQHYGPYLSQEPALHGPSSSMEPPTLLTPPTCPPPLPPFLFLTPPTFPITPHTTASTAHWGELQNGGHTARVYYPPPHLPHGGLHHSPAQPPHHTTHYLPPSI